MVAAAARLDHDEADLLLVEAQARDRVVELAIGAQRPQIAAELAQRVDILWERVGAEDREGREAFLAIELEGDVAVLDGVGRNLGFERRELDTFHAGFALQYRLVGGARVLRACGELGGALRDPLLELAPREEAVDESPLFRFLGFEPLGLRREDIGQVAANLAFVHEAREAPVPGRTPNNGTSGSETAELPSSIR